METAQRDQRRILKCSMMKVFAQGYEIGVNHCVPRPTASNPGYSSRLATCSPCRGGRRSVDPRRGTNRGQNHGVFRQSHFQRYWVFDPKIEVRKLRRGGGNDKGATFERLAPAQRSRQDFRSHDLDSRLKFVLDGENLYLQLTAGSTTALARRFPPSPAARLRL
jgi:hypothetical protein